GGDRTTLRVLTSARDQMTGERTRTVNALTALLRTVELGIDARRALSATTIATIAAWRTPSPSTVPATTRAVCRAEAIRPARRIHALDTDLAANHTALSSALTAQAPELSDLRGVGPEKIAVIPQLESREAIDSAREIGSVDGVAALFVGPADLAVATGYSADTPEFTRLLDDVASAAKELELPVGTAVGSAAAARDLVGHHDFIMIANDASLLGQAARALVSEARGA
ncbi:MAG: transposase, partial [Pseudonocardiales bacterium]|nr:transposase [Pseudonocardiales bacterium]